MQNIKAIPIEPARISIACISCKTRKRRCDGGTPKCAHCTARNVECSYAAIRRTRGPAKKKIQRDLVEAQSDKREYLPPSSLLPDDGNRSPSSRDDNISTVNSMSLADLLLPNGVIVNKPALQQSTTATESSQTQVTIKNRIPIFPEFLLPGTFDNNLKTYKTAIAEGIAARNFIPLMPLHICHRLVENSFADIMAEHQLMPLSHFLTHLEAQYAASSLDPADNSARWALVNAIIALGGRSKTAPGSQALYNITLGIFENAMKTLRELIIEDPCLLSIQALLAMAIFTREVGNMSAFVVLASNASRQLELLTLSWSSMDQVIDGDEMGQYEQAYKIANAFEKYTREFLGTNAALCEGQAQFNEPQSR
ncbi:hypothetical protein N431DRAFT_378564 [Stipitochalara longipes BDJ]|nr:hypothetical protein N431DRAFT_378564 [Stipitochalara longipes BDJ]